MVREILTTCYIAIIMIGIATGVYTLVSHERLEDGRYRVDGEVTGWK